MKEQLNPGELKSLVKSVFSLRPADKGLAVLADVPDSASPDTDAWRERRALAYHWVMELDKVKAELNLERVTLIVYPNVHSNNADLPEQAYITPDSPEDMDSDKIAATGTPHKFEELLREHQIILAPTQHSTTAPLKLLAKKLGFRAATMPGFSSTMIPALRLDYNEINRRVWDVKNLLDPATGMDIRFTVKDDKSYNGYFDLRHRQAHASGGRFPEPGVAGNLPSGESYIVPYEGEKGALSASEGVLPVQFGEEVVLYRIENNRAVEVTSRGAMSEAESAKIDAEPAYSNIAEIGFGVLKDFGIQPTGEILLDEKLGLHIAFGRSDHFGGAIGVKHFTAPDKVVHIDRIYIPEIQSKVHVDEVALEYEDGTKKTIMKDGMYTIF